MKTRSGEQKKIRVKNNGNQIKEFRLIALEPALWDMYDRLAKMAKKTRSTFIRCDIKDNRRLEKMAGIDWEESNK